MDDKIIRIQSNKTSQPEKIKEIIFNKYKINKNFIEIVNKPSLKDGFNFKT